MGAHEEKNLPSGLFEFPIDITRGFGVDMALQIESGRDGHVEAMKSEANHKAKRHHDKRHPKPPPLLVQVKEIIRGASRGEGEDEPKDAKNHVLSILTRRRQKLRLSSLKKKEVYL